MNLTAWLTNALDQINAVTELTALEQLRVKLLGKKGELTLKLKELGNLPIEERKALGSELNQFKQQIQAAITNQKQNLAQAEAKDLNNNNNKLGLDISLGSSGQELGSLHPVTRIRAEIEQIFSRMGFTVAEGPEVEDEHHNFTALNFPESHPARDEHDTFYFGDGRLLRTHTSTVQIRSLTGKYKDVINANNPIKLIAPGKVYRCDYDLTHTPMFHQLEGLMIGDNISFANLKAILTEFLKILFNQADLKFRFRPSFFPFTEPSAEMDISCENFPSKHNWLEILGCGMVHPNVLEFCNIDSEKYTGWAFGIGLDRLAMLKYKIPDLRLMFENDLRFLRQFG